MRPDGWLISVGVAIAVAIVPLAAAQSTTVLPEPQDFPPCDDVPEAVLFADADVGFENLAFDGNGTLWLTAFDEGLYSAGPSGDLVFIVKDDRPRPATLGPLDAPNAFMGVDVGPDGALYVAQGLSITAPVEARVLRFPVPGAPEFEVYAEGFDGANGLAVTPDGVVYLVHGFRDAMWKITAPGVWTEWTKVATGNGLVEHPDGERLVVSEIADASTSVVALALADPADRDVLFTFNAPPSAEGPGLPIAERPVMGKGIDDLVVARDGRVYGSAHLRGQVLRGDPATGEGCVLLDLADTEGASEGDPTSVRIANGFGDWDGWLFSVDSGGAVWAIDIRAPGDAAVDAPPAESPRPAPMRGTPLSAGLLLGVALLAGRLMKRR